MVAAASELEPKSNSIAPGGVYFSILYAKGLVAL